MNDIFKEFIESLNNNEVKYLIIGGYAVNFHGFPRYTKDIDFWIWMKKDNIKKALNALNEFGFGSLGLTIDDLNDPKTIIQLGYEPYRVDLLLSVDGLDFDGCYKRKQSQINDGVEIHFLSIEDLVKAKKIAGRNKDIMDAGELEKIMKAKKND